MASGNSRENKAEAPKAAAAGRGGRGRTPLVQPGLSSPRAKGGGQADDAGPSRGERRQDLVRQRRDERLSFAARQRKRRQMIRYGFLGVAVLVVLGIAWSVYANVTATKAAPPPGHKVAAQEPPAGIHIQRLPNGGVPTHTPYNSTPPTSGPHFSDQTSPTYWGVHTQPVINEIQVHNLEHGGIMLQYNCDCPDVVKLFDEFADPKTGYPTKVIAAPYPWMPKDTVAMTAWNYLWTGKPGEVNADLVRRFIKAHVDNGPEQIPSETQTLQAWENDSSAPKP